MGHYLLIMTHFFNNKREIMNLCLRNNLILTFGIISLLTQVAFAEDAGVFSVTSGIDYSSGKYGSQDRTDIISVPIMGKYEVDDWTLKLTIPYVSITGPGNVSPGIGKFKNTPTTKRSTESGLGDIVVASTYAFYNGNNGGPAIDITGKIKFGTADEKKGLGTGENDYIGLVDLYQSFGDFTALASIGYRIYGDSNEASLDNVFFGSVGGSYKIISGTSAGVLYDYRPAITSNGSVVSEVTAFINHKINENWKSQAYLVKGFANGSPDYGIGALVGYVF